MNSYALRITLALLLAALSGAAFACQYKEGKDKFAEYAECRYGADAVVVVDLPEGSSWEQCIYYIEAFRPAKLLAVTRDDGGKEDASIFDRHQIGNPCYLTKGACDRALKAQQQ